MEQITSNNRPFFLTYGGLAGLVLLLLPYLALGGPADPVQGGKALPPPHTLALIDSLTTVGQLDAALERADPFPERIRGRPPLRRGCRGPSGIAHVAQRSTG